MSKFKLCIVGAGLLLGACSKSTTSGPSADSRAKEAKAEAKLCKNMDKLKESVVEYPTITAETPVATIQDANSKVDKAVKEVKESAKDVNNPRILEVQSAYQNLQNSLNTVPSGSTTVGEQAENVRADAKDFRDAWDRLYESMQCGA
jgi:hypothetical protein